MGGNSGHLNKMLDFTWVVAWIEKGRSSFNNKKKVKAFIFISCSIYIHFMFNNNNRGPFHINNVKTPGPGGIIAYTYYSYQVWAWSIPLSNLLRSTFQTRTSMTIIPTCNGQERIGQAKSESSFLFAPMPQGQPTNPGRVRYKLVHPSVSDLRWINIWDIT